MARIFTDGFELGDLSEYYQRKLDGQNILALGGGYKRSGNYGFYAYDNHSGAVGCWIYRILNAAYSEAYFRVAWRPITGQFEFYVSKDSHSPMMSVRGYVDTNMQILINGSPVQTSSFMPRTDQWYLVETYYKCADVDGQVIVKVNGVEILNYTGDTNPGASNFNRLYLGAVSRSGYNRAYFDDIAINDTTGTVDNSWCGEGHIVLLKPNAVGDHIDLMGSDGNAIDNHLLVDDIPSNGDTDYVYSDVVDEYDLYNVEDITLPLNHKITRVWVEARAKDPTMGNLALLLKSGTTQEESDALPLLTTYSTVASPHYLTNPDDGQPWEESDINSLQIGVKIK